MSKNYYDILGVQKDASDKDIKSAYRKLSLRFHPDKQSGKSEAEQKEAESKFKEINEAYQVLSDPEKKSNYDRFGDPDAKGYSGFNFEGSPFDDFGDLFSRQFGGNPFGGFGRRGEKQIVNGTDIKMQIPLTIEDIFNGCTKKTKLHRNIRCPNCHGDGGTGKKTCLHCGGTGEEIVAQRTSLGYMQMSKPCSHCGGTGYTIEHECPTCGGTGFKVSDEVVEINFPPGMLDNFAITMEGRGNEAKDKRGKNGDFYAIAKHAYDQTKYMVHGLDVYEKIHIPYYDMLLGCEYVIDIPNGTKKKINIESCTPDGKLLRLYREGIKATNGQVGDYYIEVHYKFPENISEDERRKLEDIKVINYNKAN